MSDLDKSLEIASPATFMRSVPILQTAVPAQASSDGLVFQHGLAVCSSARNASQGIYSEALARSRPIPRDMIVYVRRSSAQKVL
jgi:hypothetical protein